MAKPTYPKEFLDLCASVTGKRPKTVIDHILKHGHITTEELKNKYGCQCFIYLEKMPEANLQIDHRVPYEVAGEADELKADDFMLLCGSANRAKSWSCEHCENWKSIKDKNICLSCYWAYPEKYNHVAMQQIRRVDLVWQGGEVAQYDKLKADAAKSGLELPQFVKKVLAKALE